MGWERDYAVAHAGFLEAVGAGDRLEAEWWLSEMKAANEVAEAELFADRFIRNLEAWGRD